LTWVLRTLTGRPITDGQSGYRALSQRAAAAAEIAHDYNYAQVLTLDLLRRGARYAEVPIGYAFREHGRSFVRLHRYLRAVVPTAWQVLRAPLPPPLHAGAETGTAAPAAGAPSLATASAGPGPAAHPAARLTAP
jgi:hypothetical protein